MSESNTSTTDGRPALSLSEKVCLITGAAGGIGQATARRMAELHAEAIVLTDRDEGSCDELAHELAQRNVETMVSPCDVTSEAQVIELMRSVAERYGRIDVLHNNAALLDNQLVPVSRIDTLTEDVWDQIFNVNVKGLWFCTKQAAPIMRASKAASIINAASVSSLLAYPDEPAYCASKAAVVQLTRSTALDLARYRIRCNCYCPASIDTPMLDPFWRTGDRAALEGSLINSHLVERLGRPEDIANLVCFLASDDSAFINGANYVIDGGSLAWRGVRS